MTEKKIIREGQGTFAQLYDVQEELSRRNTKPLGRPPKKVQRKPTTVHLTKTETRNLNKLHLLIGEQFSVNRSELVGIAIDTLTLLLEEKGKNAVEIGQIRDIETFRRFIFDFMKS
ncbi:MAG: hypothetical protein HC875_09930 [Anaerolineales bacterium]|nr:hypothetical protein [Anaerolineales bacterium]